MRVSKSLIIELNDNDSEALKTALIIARKTANDCVRKESGLIGYTARDMAKLISFCDRLEDKI